MRTRNGSANSKQDNDRALRVLNREASKVAAEKLAQTHAANLASAKSQPRTSEHGAAQGQPTTAACNVAAEAAQSGSPESIVVESVSDAAVVTAVEAPPAVHTQHTPPITPSALPPPTGFGQEWRKTLNELHPENIIRRYNLIHGNLTPDAASMGRSMLQAPERYVAARDAAMWPFTHQQILFGDFITAVWGLTDHQACVMPALNCPLLLAFVKVKGLSLLTQAEGCNALSVERACQQARSEALDLVALIQQQLEGCA